MDLKKSIPRIINSKSWDSVPIIDNGEKLVSLRNIINKNSRIAIEPRYFLGGHDGALNDIYVREQVLYLLTKASKMLPDGYKFMIWDAWRPISVQKSIFNMIFKNFREDNGTWGNYNDEELKRYIVTNCCSLPSTDPLNPATHNTGGAVDLSIINDKGKLLEMGTCFDEFKKNVPTRYYEEKLEKEENLSLEEMTFLNNRRLLYNIMTEVDFVNFSEEWWHFNFGNQGWGDIKERTAIYGKASLN